MATLAMNPSARAGSPPAVGRELMRTARVTGLLYLGLALTGLLGSVIVRAQLFASDDPNATLSNLVENEPLARLGIALELGIVLTQALAAIWFYRLFRRVDSFAAGSLAAFGMVNAIAILGSAAVLASALEVADDPSLAVPGGSAAVVQLLYVISGHLWGVAGIFFGLWLIPMGWLVLRSGWLPRVLGWVLTAGGVGYLASAFVTYLLPGAGIVSDLLLVPSSIGEFWAIGYLLFKGVHPSAAAAATLDEAAQSG